MKCFHVAYTTHSKCYEKGFIVRTGRHMLFPSADRLVEVMRLPARMGGFIDFRYCDDPTHNALRSDQTVTIEECRNMTHRRQPLSMYSESPEEVHAFLAWIMEHYNLGQWSVTYDEHGVPEMRIQARAK